MLSILWLLRKSLLGNFTSSYYFYIYIEKNNCITECFVLFRNSYSSSVEFSKVSITVNSPGYNSEFVVADAEHNNLIFHGKEMRKFPYQFEAPQQNESSEIRITTISLYMSSDKMCCIILRFSAIGRETNFLSRLYPEIQQLRYV